MKMRLYVKDKWFELICGSFHNNEIDILLGKRQAIKKRPCNIFPDGYIFFYKTLKILVLVKYRV